MLNLFGQNHNLPTSLTSFVGRERIIKQIEQLLDNTRLLTLTGPGGSGKTRLALEVSRTMLERYPDGVWFIELASLSNPTLIAQVITQEMGLVEEALESLLEALALYWRDKKVLLILDNCEHLVEECARVAAYLLKSCTRLQIMTTSREALSIAGETTLLIPPLALPPLEGEPQLAVSSEASRLFTDRVRAIHPTFKVDNTNFLAVARICRRLDGIPLALELAAARTRVLAIEQIAARLDDRLGLLKSVDRSAEPRQLTLQATIDWSYTLLTEPEKVLFRRLAIFVGSWNMEAAEAICTGDYQTEKGTAQLQPTEILDLLDQLVNKSLVLAEQAGEMRYRMLETIRHYAQGKLAQNVDLAATQRSHISCYLALAEEARTKLNRPDQVEWLDRLETEHDNLRAALSWATTNSNEAEHPAPFNNPNFLQPHLVGLRLGGALWRFWQTRNHIPEGIGWLEKIVAQAEGKPVPVQLKARTYLGLAVLLSSSDFEHSLYYHNENLRLRQELNDLAGVADALNGLGWLYFNHQHDLGKVRQFCEQSQALAEKLDDKWRIASALRLKCMMAIITRNPAEAVPLSYRAIQLFQEAGDTNSASTGIGSLGALEFRMGNYRAARAIFKESLPAQLAQKNLVGFVITIVHLAGLAVIVPKDTGPERARQAARLMSAAEKIATSQFLVEEPPFSKSIKDPMNAAIRSQLDEATYQAMVAEGKQLGPEEIVALALQIASSEDEPATAASHASTPYNSGGLSPRELEVLGLVVKGLSNPEIAKELVLSRRTVDAHLRSIYNKLEVNSRYAASQFALENKLV